MPTIKLLSINEIVTSVRELILDINPVSCFTLQKQGLSFSANTEKAEVTGSTNATLLYSEAPKFYDLVSFLKDKGVDVKLSIDYVPLDYSSSLKDIPTVSLDSPKEIMRRNYFSVEMIYKTVLDHFQKFYDYEYSPYVDTFVYFNGSAELDRMLGVMTTREQQKVVLWAAYFLIEERRKNTASMNFLRTKNGEVDDLCAGAGDFRNRYQETTTKVGETFVLREGQEELGKVEQDFTALWGDKYDFLTKLQLSIRDRFEKLFNDYSLRDSTINSTSFVLEKNWISHAYADTLSLSLFTKDLLLTSGDL